MNTRTLVLPYLLGACLLGCGGESAPGVVLTSLPDTTPPDTTEPDITAPDTTEPDTTGPEITDPDTPGDPGCRYHDSVEPAWPADPQDECYREWTDAGGAPLVWAHTRITDLGSSTRWVRDSYLAPGTRVAREVRQEGPHGPVFVSRQRFDLPPEGTLPDTYGEPATVSEHWVRDAAGRVLRHETDVALNGVDVADEWDYAGDTVVEHRRYHKGELVIRETFRDDGQPLEQHHHGSRRVWRYGASGLLEEESQYHDEVLFETITWVMLDAERPLERTIVRSGHPLSHDRWTYDEAGRLRVEEGSRWVYGVERHHRRELDTLGREIRYVEDTEQLDCHRYEQRTNWLADTDELLEQNTTCDGQPFQTIEATFDAAHRPLHYERHFYGNKSKPSHEEREWVRDTCGAAVTLTSLWGGAITRHESREHDDLGRITRREMSHHGGEPHVIEYTYDAAGYLTRAGSQRWDWTPDGRLSAIGWDHGAPAPFLEATAFNLRFVYSCDE